MNDWGLPDWKSAETYGETECWELERWRWEFMRRRKDLREAFDRSSDSMDQTNLATDAVIGVSASSLSIDDPGFLALAGESEEFGYTHLPNPRISDQPLAVLRFIAVDPLKFFPGEFYQETGVQLQKSNEVAIIFDISKPLEDQLKSAKRQLDGMQTHRYGIKFQGRKHKKLWPTYLRVLDGREAGATWSEIVTVLPPHMRHTEQSARDTYDQADRLRFNF